MKFLIAKEDRDLIRFQQEARLASKLNHPGIAKIYDLGLTEESPFLCMEFIDGESLEQSLERAKPDTPIQHAAVADSRKAIGFTKVVFVAAALAVPLCVSVVWLQAWRIYMCRTVISQQL
ncbi:MAG: hypothetical protein K2X93_03340 [Candidatus Obscuribacterales bacterium]|nr:hypothetical protein [Candidatus Obscuribacterales bacterium]